MPQSPTKLASWDLTQFSQHLFHCSKHGLDLAATLLHLLQVQRIRQLPLGRLGPPFWITAIDPAFISSHDLLEETWVIGSGLNQVISNCSMMFLLWQQKLQNKFCHDILHTKILHQNLGLGSFLESPNQLLGLTLSVTSFCCLQPVHIEHSQVFCLLQAFQKVDHFQQILDHLLSVLFALYSLHHPRNLLNHPNSFHRGMFKLNVKWDADSLFCLLILNATAAQYTCSLRGIYHPPLSSK